VSGVEVAEARLASAETRVPVPTAEQFQAFRKEWNHKAESGGWKLARKELQPSGGNKKEFIWTFFFIWNYKRSIESFK
jgi:hypothetical protein